MMDQGPYSPLPNPYPPLLAMLRRLGAVALLREGRTQQKKRMGERKRGRATPESPLL